VHDSARESDKGSILVVEDDEDIRDEIREALEERGYPVLEAGNGQEALATLFADPPPDVRLIVSDLNMPRMSGMEMLQVLSSYSRSSRIPVIVVSVTPPTKLPKANATIAEWLVKPFDMDELVALVAGRFSPFRVAPPT
jgi:CheY-like chemotaxis protein